jgi:SAM-dependent methyltransferase
VSEPDVENQRAETLERWEGAAAGWSRRADRVRKSGMPVSLWMIEHLGLQAGQRVLELAAGPGDSGFLAAELIAPSGTLICSDGTEAMLEVARAQADRLGIENVEFKRLELEWLDLPIASVDAVLCRFGLMLSFDPEAAAREMRRVLRPGGKAAVAVWDDPAKNPWMTIAGRALIDVGLSEPPDPQSPGPFALSAPGALADVLAGAGFLDVTLDSVAVAREYPDIDEYIAETLDLSVMFATAYRAASEADQASARAAIGERVAPFARPGGSLNLPGEALVAAASA